MASRLRRINSKKIDAIQRQAESWFAGTKAIVKQRKKEVIDEFGRLFVERAQFYLERDGVETAKYKKYITYEEKKQRIVVKSPRSKEPDIMWYLEYGTGIDGLSNPHPDAAEIGWKYAINATRSSAWIDYDDETFGWVFEKRSTHVYSPKSKDISLGKSEDGGKEKIFTTGITPVRYLWRARKDTKELLKLARKIVRERYARK